MRGRTNILARPYPVVNADVEHFEAVEDIEVGSFVEPIYESNVNNDFFRSTDITRKILRVIGNYFIIAFVDGVVSGDSNDLYSVGVFEFANGTFIPCSNIIPIGLSTVGGLVNYSDNIYLICGRGYGDEYGYAKMCKFYVNMETFEIYDYENFFISKNEGAIGSNNIFVIDAKIEFVFFLTNTSYQSNGNYFKAVTIARYIFDDVNNFDSNESVSNRYDSGYGSDGFYDVKESAYEDDLIKVGDGQYVATMTRSTNSQNFGKRYYRDVCFFDLNDILDNGRINVKTFNSIYSDKNGYLDNIMRPIIVDKKNFIWTYGGSRLYKGKDLIKSISQLNFGTNQADYKCIGSYVEDGLCILFLYCNYTGSTVYGKQKAFVMRYDETLDAVTFSNEIYNKNIWASSQCVKISDSEYLLLKEKGWMIVNYKDGILTEGERTNKVKNYTSNSRIIGFAKRGGFVGEVIEVYVPKDKV